ncbi:MAG: hypothetical protein ACRCW2_08220 [Cellulosilyticaceae bacterium]
MIKSIDESMIGQVIDFTWPICQRCDLTSYPIKKSKLDLETSLIQALKHPDDQVLGCFKEDRLIGSINLFVELKENYLRVITYIAEDFEAVMEQLVSWLKEEYPAFKVHFCYPKENTTAIQYFETRRYECIEASHDLRLTVQETPYRSKEQTHITRLTKDEFEAYADFHNRHAGEEMYWNSKRLYEAFDSWYIYLYTQKATIQGSIMMCKAGADAIEVFGLFVEETMDQTDVAREILDYAIHQVMHEEQAVKQVIFFVEEKDRICNDVARQIGFEDLGGYCCYAIDL